MKKVLIFVLLFTSQLVLANNANNANHNEISTDIPLAEQDKAEFLRINKDEQGKPLSLQLANVRYVPISGIPKDMYVDLISAVHVADKSYYENLNQLFKSYDVVLYELVAPEGVVVGDPKASEGKSLLSMVQTGMKNVLGLTFQLDEIDYSASNFVHADISPDDFKKSMADKGESFFSMFLRMWMVGLQQQATNPDAVTDAELIMALFSKNRERELKIIAAQQFISMDPVMKAIEGEQGSTIVTTRNLKALKVLRQQLEKGNKTFAIFYGAAHMPEMARVMMQEFKLKPENIHWIDAWNLE